MAYILECHPEIARVVCRGALAARTIAIRNKEALRFARYEKTRMRLEIQGRRNFSVIFELGLAAAKTQSRLIEYQASSSLTHAQLSIFSKYKAHILSKGAILGQISLAKSNESEDMMTALGLATEDELARFKELLRGVAATEETLEADGVNHTPTLTLEDSMD